MRKLLLQSWSFAPHSRCNGGGDVARLPLRRSIAPRQLSMSHGSAEEGFSGWQRVLDRTWLLPNAATATTKVVGKDGRWRRGGDDDAAPGCGDGDCAFHVIRDDLLHPVMGGNKLRKLDALIPLLVAHGVTDVVTCGGCQSAHTAAVAVACAEVGMRAHLLLRGERPAIPTGYNLVAGMYGHVRYVPRCEYADRQAMLQKHAMRVAGGDSSRIVSLRNLASESSNYATRTLDAGLGNDNKTRVAVVNEGAGDCHAMLGLIRLVEFLSLPSKFGKTKRLRLIVDCGTGTTAVGLALGICLHRLPWQVYGVMLADTQEGYENQADRLLSEFAEEYNIPPCTWEGQGNDSWCATGSDLPLIWQQRCHPRKFGRVLPGEVETCQRIARETGILLDPIYTLAGWDMAKNLCCFRGGGDEAVALLHTGGTLGLFGLAQRFPLQF